MSQGSNRIRILVGIATAGRRSILSETLKELSRQIRQPDRVAICPATSADVDQCILSGLPFSTAIVHGDRGSSRQRNAILRTAHGFDAVVFFDDDFFPCKNYLANVESLLVRELTVVVATGKVIEDGVHGPGLTPDYARRKLASAVAPPHNISFEKCYSAYGCNMIIRVAPVMEHCIAFDEMLPLYGWQEDTDFSRQLAPFGQIVRSDALMGVHLGVKDGRTSGIKFGYSQVANPIYLIRKGTLSLPRGARLMVKNLLANAMRFFRSEPYIDRLGRLKGNLRAIRDLVRGRLHPMGILELE